MDMGISGKCALVLGAGGGLGGAIARTLAREGAKVALADVDQSAAKQTEEEIRSKGGEAFAMGWDLADLSVIDPNISLIEAQYGPVSILVNNTGGPPPTTASAQPAQQWSRISSQWCFPSLR